MKNSVFLLAFLLLANLTMSIPVDTNVLKLLPLKVGNVWVYREDGGYPYNGCYAYQRYVITGTSQINDKTYFQFSFVSRPSSINCQYVPNNISRLYSSMQIRLDSLTGNIYIAEDCGTISNIISDSLASRKFDSATICIGSNNVKREICSDTSLVNIFGMSKSRKTFFLPHASGAETQSYAMDIGLYDSYWGESSYWWNEKLRGCVINGVSYGDTSMLVGINLISADVPSQFSLSQNYPNPFNPSTNIRFEIRLRRFLASRLGGIGVSEVDGLPAEGQGVLTSLIIFDVLGREITTLVNEKLKPGSYEVNWDASNFPSGVYYYSLVGIDPSTSLRVTDTRKMVLIK